GASWWGAPCVAVQVPSGLGCDLRDIERDVLLLSAALHGDIDVVRGLNGIEDFLGMLWVVELRAVDGRDQIARPQPQFGEYRLIAARVGAKAAHLAGCTVVRGHCAHDLV